MDSTPRSELSLLDVKTRTLRPLSVVGKEVAFTPKGPGGKDGKGKRTAKLGADGNSIEVNETATLDTPDGAVTIQTTRKWTLSSDGKTLKIDMTIDGPQTKQLLKRSFIKT